ncbi:hypothetical protein ACPB9E_13950 [Streptomyces exfoliatus]
MLSVLVFPLLALKLRGRAGEEPKGEPGSAPWGEAPRGGAVSGSESW